MRGAVGGGGVGARDDACKSSKPLRGVRGGEAHVLTWHLSVKSVSGWMPRPLLCVALLRPFMSTTWTSTCRWPYLPVCGRKHNPWEREHRTSGREHHAWKHAGRQRSFYGQYGEGAWLARDCGMKATRTWSASPSCSALAASEPCSRALSMLRRKRAGSNSNSSEYTSLCHVDLSRSAPSPWSTLTCQG